jgi:hypothetical protein
MEACAFDFDNGHCTLQLTDNEGITHAINAGAGKWIRGETTIPGPNLVPFHEANAEILIPTKIASAYGWIGEDSLEIEVRYIETAHHYTYAFGFFEDELAMRRSVSFGRPDQSITLTGVKKP